jgi:hypothetical protein
MKKEGLQLNQTNFLPAYPDVNLLGFQNLIGEVQVHL